VGEAAQREKRTALLLTQSALTKTVGTLPAADTERSKKVCGREAQHAVCFKTNGNLSSKTRVSYFK